MSCLKFYHFLRASAAFDLGLERTGGFETVAFCEIEPFAVRVLNKHWPKVPVYGDVRELTADRLSADGIVPDIIVGGFPCQDVSGAGRRAGVGEGTRSGLYAELLRLARDLRPQFILMENVAGLLSGPPERPGGWFGRVLGDLAASGYDAEWHCIPASYVGAWHRRDRVWILAYARKECGQQRLPEGPLFRQRHLFQQPSRSFARWPGRSGLPKSRICGRNDGVPDVPHRLATLGNAVVPQIPELIGRAILASLEREAA